MEDRGYVANLCVSLEGSEGRMSLPSCKYLFVCSSSHLFIVIAAFSEKFYTIKVLGVSGRYVCYIPHFYTVKVFGVYTGYLYWVYSRIFIIFINPLSPYCNINTLWQVFLSGFASASSGSPFGRSQSNMIMVMWPMDVCKRITSRTHSLRLSCVLRIHQTFLGSSRSSEGWRSPHPRTSTI